MRPAFRILPRGIEQTQYSCIFVPDAKLKDNQYFHGTINLLDQEAFSAESLESISMVSQQIMPLDEELVQYGILSAIRDDKPKSKSSSE
ncbi:hypothetical protein [Acinetobacter haemolyticus]|nr:hypothetical protein [Acinetobacter haemolyticus]NAR68615.1 hypothetical protein [Acinetobacter haemolyticus]